MIKRLIFLPASFRLFVRRAIKPPLFFPAIGLAGGITAGSRLEGPSPLLWMAVVFGLAGLALTIKRPLFRVFLLILFFLFGVLLESNSRVFPADHVCFLPTGKGVLEGRVRSLPETAVKEKRRMTRFVLEAESWWSGRQLYPASGKVQVFFFYPPKLEYGEQIRFRGTLEAPKRATNPGEFDYADFLSHHRIARVFQSFGERAVLKSEPPRGTWRVKFERFRTRIGERIRSLFPFPESELIQAIWLGFRRGMPDDIQDLFARSGTAHLLSISGLHVSLVGGFFYFLLRLCGLARKVNAFATILVIAAYALLAGCVPPVLRSAMMGLLILGGILLERDHEIWNVLVVSFFVFLLTDPEALFLLSFQLSYLSVAVLVLFAARSFGPEGEHPPRLPWFAALRRNLHETMRTSLLITVVLLPVFVRYFHTVSFAGILANVIAIPLTLWILIASLMALGLSVASPFLAAPMVWVIVRLIDVLFAVLRTVIRIPLGVWSLPELPVWLWALYWTALAVVYWHPALKPRRLLGTFAVVIGLLTALLAHRPSSVTFLDAGFSDVMAVRSPHRVDTLMLAGRQLSESRLRWMLRSFLMSRGVRTLQLLDLSAQSARRFPRLSHAFLRTFCRMTLRGKPAASDITVFRSKRGRALALWYTIQQRTVLVVFEVTPEMLSRLSVSAIKPADILYVSHQKKQAAPELAQLIKQNRPDVIVMNQRQDLAVWLSKIRNSGNTRFHFIAQNGAASLIWERGRWSVRPVFPSGAA